MKKILHDRGFTLVEVAAAIALFLIFAIGIYSGISYALKTVYHSRIRILELSLLNSEMEIIKNLPYSSVGLVSGVPSGILSPVKTVAKSGIDFRVSASVKYVDDPYDGTATSTPADLSPYDYKMVQLSANCVDCLQREPIVVTSNIVPRGFETSTYYGSLFIQVIDANGLPVPEADINISNFSASPAVNFTDHTDMGGWYRLLNAPTGTLVYDVTASKPGYSAEFTTSSSAQNPSPAILPRSVASQAVTQLTLRIDRTGIINFHTINDTCAAIPSASIGVRGEKLVGLSPLIYKFDRTLTSDSGGNYVLNEAEWDTYHLSATGTYDLAGTIPTSPFHFLPGSTQEVSVILKPHTANSLLVKVKDASTGLPLSGATVKLNGSSSRNALTGLGYRNQTDWVSGGNVSSVSNLDIITSPENVYLAKLGAEYLQSGYLESATFDLGGPVNFNNIEFSPITQPTESGGQSVLLLFATSNSSSPATWSFVGPDGTNATFYTATNTLIHSSANGKRYARYRLFLETASTTFTPRVSDISFTYTNSCFAPGQAFFEGLVSGNYTVEITKNGYNTSTEAVLISGNKDLEIILSP